ncbi:hypothetical protein T484DRAFT_1986644 [Baffinella frigidus]|nr:hypothetical protein T484DRAFT_1986644 [Cryptophyta sp. CCMP2293]
MPSPAFPRWRCIATPAGLGVIDCAPSFSFSPERGGAIGDLRRPETLTPARSSSAATGLSL